MCGLKQMIVLKMQQFKRKNIYRNIKHKDTEKGKDYET